MPSRRGWPPRLLPLLSSILLAAPLVASPGPPAPAGELVDARGAVFLRFSLSPSGTGFEPPTFGMHLGPDVGGGRPGHRIDARGPRISLDQAVSLELNGRGKGRIELVGFSWSWRLTDVIPERWFSPDGDRMTLMARSQPRK